MEKKLYPRNNIEAGLLTFNTETGFYVLYKDFDIEKGEYRQTITTKNPVEAWTAYLDAVDVYVRRSFRGRRYDFD